MGGGNKAVELTTSRALFEIRGAFGPEGAAVATRKYVLALTDDPQQTAEIVPDEPPTTSDATILAASAFATLMQGVPFPPKRGLNQVDYIETLFQLSEVVMQKLEVMQQEPEAAPMMAEKIAGLMQVGNHIEEHIQVLAMDDSQKERVKAYEAAVQKMMLSLRAYAERLQEAQAAKQQQGAQMSPEAQAKIIDAQIVGQTKAKINEDAAAHKEDRKDIALDNEQKRKNAATLAEINRKLALTQTDIAVKHATAQVDLAHAGQQHAQEMDHSEQDAQQEAQQAANKPATK
jgi:hypothetical protein